MLISQPVTSCLTSHSELCMSRLLNNQSHLISIYRLQWQPCFGFESSVSSSSMTSGDPVVATVTFCYVQWWRWGWQTCSALPSNQSRDRRRGRIPCCWPTGDWLLLYTFVRSVPVDSQIVLPVDSQIVLSFPGLLYGAMWWHSNSNRNSRSEGITSRAWQLDSSGWRGETSDGFGRWKETVQTWLWEDLFYYLYVTYAL